MDKGLIVALVLLRQMLTLHENKQLFLQVRQQAVDLQVEVNDRKRAEAQLAYDALHDALTGLPNRVLFMNRLRQCLELAKRQKDQRFSVLFLDLDHFKLVNDSLGHACGDQLLIEIAQRLRMCMRSGDTVARLSGDEFVVLLKDTAEPAQAASTANRLEEYLKQPFNLNGRQFFATASIGIVAAAHGYARAEDILRDADIAMYEAKTQGKAGYQVFNIGMREQAQKQLALGNDLHWAMERNELELDYQPIFSLQSNAITGFEALLRWRHPQLGLIAPADFIPIAEETGLIVPIGQWVLYEACRQLREWQGRFPQHPPLTMSVNVSAAQFAAPAFVEQLAELLQKVALDPATLRLELAESVWFKDAAEACAVFQKLSTMGVQLHMDDFGAGYSSLANLKQFPIRMLKIDRAFLDKMSDKNNKALIQAVIAMAHNLGMEAVAEGVETEEQLNNLRQLGCDYGQGYFLSRPTGRTGIEALLRARGGAPVTPAQKLVQRQLLGGALATVHATG